MDPAVRAYPPSCRDTPWGKLGCAMKAHNNGKVNPAQEQMGNEKHTDTGKQPALLREKTRRSPARPYKGNSPPQATAEPECPLGEHK